jgi:Phage integrase family
VRPRVTHAATAPGFAPDGAWLCGLDMTHVTAMTASQALGRITDWQVALRAGNKSPGTIFIYADGATRYLRWCAEADLLPMSRAALNSWIAGLLDAGSSPGTARIRQLAVRRFASWLTAGGEIQSDPFPGIKAPRYEPPLVEPLTDAELRALIATCAVPDDHTRPEDTLNDRRDEAIIRLMFETAIRSGELVDLHLDDLDLIARLITIRRGRGGEAGSSRSGRPPPRRCWSTSTTASGTRSRRVPTSGSATAASSSAATDSAVPCAAEPNVPESKASGRTGSGTPPPTAGSPPAAPSPVSWRSPAGPAPTCSSATPESTPPNVPPPRRPG